MRFPCVTSTPLKAAAALFWAAVWVAGTRYFWRYARSRSGTAGQ